jgi:hypothetical protein
MSVPKTDPAAAYDDGGLDDLAALAHGGDTYQDAPTAGPRCPGCGEGVDATAVICVNCGTNLKTGKKLSTAKVAAAPPTGGKPGKAGSPMYDRAFGVKNVGDEDKMSPQAKKILAGVLSFLLLAIVVVVVMVTSNAKKKEAARQAAMNAGPRPKLERMLTAAERSGGLTQAIKDGTLYEEMSKDEPPPPVRRRPSKDAINGYASSLGQMMPTDEARNWLKEFPTATLHGMTREDTVKLVETLYEKYKVRFVQVMLKTVSSTTCDLLVITVPDWPKEERGTADGPYRQEYWKWAEAFLKKLGQEVEPDVDQYYMVIRLKKGADVGDADDEEGEDGEEMDEDEDGDTPAKPANRKPRKKPGAAKPGAGAPAGEPGAGGGTGGAAGATPAQPNGQ